MCRNWIINIEMEIIKNLIISYFDIVRKNFQDLVPKTIMHFLVNNFKASLQNELVTQLYKEEIMTDLMRETEDVASRRKSYKEMKELLRRAMEIVNEVRDFNTFKWGIKGEKWVPSETEWLSADWVDKMG